MVDDNNTERRPKKLFVFAFCYIKNEILFFFINVEFILFFSKQNFQQKHFCCLFLAFCVCHKNVTMTTTKNDMTLEYFVTHTKFIASTSYIHNLFDCCDVLKLAYFILWGSELRRSILLVTRYKLFMYVFLGFTFQFI